MAAAWPVEEVGVSYPLLLRGWFNLVAALSVLLAAAASHRRIAASSSASGSNGAASKKQKQQAAPDALGTIALLRKHRVEFMGAGVAATLLLGTNMCRRALVPLVGAELGLPVEIIGVAMTTMGASG